MLNLVTVLFGIYCPCRSDHVSGKVSEWVITQLWW